ncbi:hypothetical protein [Amycolatopsis sacchari]|uniref:hypothetical protein n=1 Tax=Amycolatopsis sacchari TaxID=115433 RepID=UPI003D740526
MSKIDDAVEAAARAFEGLSQADRRRALLKLASELGIDLRQGPRRGGPSGGFYESSSGA